MSKRRVVLIDWEVVMGAGEKVIHEFTVSDNLEAQLRWDAAMNEFVRYASRTGFDIRKQSPSDYLFPVYFARQNGDCILLK